MKGFVYFLSTATALCKIGRTVRRPSARIAEYAPKLPFETTLAHVIPCDDCTAAEREVHSVLEAQRVRGEWFQLKPSDIEEIQEGILDFVGQQD